MYWHAPIYRSSTSRLASAPIHTIVTIYTHTHRPGRTNGCHTQDGRATVHGPGCRCACGASVHAHLHPGFWADAHMWTRPCGVGPAHGFCQAQSTPPPSPLRACRLRQSASAARCGMAPMPTAVTPHAIVPMANCRHTDPDRRIYQPGLPHTKTRTAAREDVHQPRTQTRSTTTNKPHNTTHKD